MKIFISQPMRGYTTEDIAQERARIKAIFNGNDVVNNIVNIDVPVEVNNPAIYKLGIGLSTMAYADMVVLPTDSFRYPGCAVEEKVAREYEIPLVYIPMYPGKKLDETSRFAGIDRASNL